MDRLLAGGLGIVLACCAADAAAQDIQWRSTASSSPQQPALTAPAAALGRPVPVDNGGALSSALYTESAAPHNPQAALSGYPPGSIIPVQAPPPDAYNCGPVTNPIPPPGLPPTGLNPIPPSGGAAGGSPLFGYNWLGTTSSGTRTLFQSDHCFDNFISPVTNPFLFEDPRSLTEIRPIFMFQATPGGNWLFGNGNAGYFGVEARLAVTERLSFVINKLGVTWQDPQNGMDLLDKTGGWSELWLGPKYTLIRNDSSGTLLAAGLTFQIPEGSSRVEQNTGTLSLTPYASFAQNFGRNSYGSFNFMNTTGYALSVNDQRTDYFYSSFHLDFDLANAHKIYPLIELNWFEYTKAGKATDFGFEGRDLFNFGSEGVSGIGTLTVAPGVRYKFNESMQAGIGLEFPLVNPKDLVQFRMTIDFILRY
jgi:hypothetical protein